MAHEAVMSGHRGKKEHRKAFGENFGEKE